MESKIYYWEKPTAPNIIYEKIPGLNSLDIAIYVNVGSRDEIKSDLWGISHYCEHMNFNGTETRTGKEIKTSLQTYGGNINAFTSYDKTVYTCKVPKHKLEIALDLLTDLTFFSKFADEDIEKERSIITAETIRSLSDPEDLFSDMVQSNLFNDSTLAHPILGTLESVKNMSADNLRLYRDKFYCAENSTYSIVGGLDEKEVYEAIMKCINEIPSGEKNNFRLKIKNLNVSGKFEYKAPIEECKVSISYLTDILPYTEKGYALDLLNKWLGNSGFSSKLFQIIREKLGLCYSVYSNYMSFDDIGALQIRSGIFPDKHEEFINNVWDIIYELRGEKESLLKDEIKIIKEYTKSNYLLESDELNNRAYINSYYANKYGKTCKKLLDPKTHCDAIDNIDIDTIEEVSSKLFDSSQIVTFFPEKNK